MPSPYLRPAERDRESPASTPGVCIRTADGRRFFFQGGTEELSMSLIRFHEAAEDLLAASSRIEWGLVTDNALTRKSVWSCQKVIQSGLDGLKCDG
jgi:hypothetical protein